MSTRKRKKKSILRSRFYRVYFALVALALVCIAVGTLWLRGLLRDYEAAQPVYVAEDVAKLFEESDYDQIYALDTAAGELSGGDRAFYVDSLSELTRGGRIEWTEAFTGNEDERKYSVTLNGDKFASFTLVPSGTRDRRGNRLWTLGSVTTNIALEEPEPVVTPEPTPEPRVYTCRVTVPEGYAVYVDGEKLSDDDDDVATRRLFEDGFLPESVENPTLVDYTFESLTVTPNITARDTAGVEWPTQLVADKALCWECPLPEDTQIRDQFGKAAVSLGKQVAKYISQDAGKGSIQSICAAGSPAEAIFNSLNNTYTTPHNGVDVRNATSSQFYRLSDDCFTCHVSFDYVIYTQKGEKNYPTAYTFCVVKVKGKDRLYNMLSF